MIGVAEIAGVMSSLKAAKDIAETMIGLRNAAAFKAKAIEFQSKIYDAMSAAIVAQEERSSLLQKVGELEKEVARLEAWDAEKQRYELKDVGSGALAYALKNEASGAEPPHWICAKCYEDGKKSILQPETRNPGRTEWMVCHRCDADIIVVGEREPPPRPTQANTKRTLRGW